MKHNKYKIVLYKLSNTFTEIIEGYLEKSNYHLEQIHEIAGLYKMKKENNRLIELPEIILIDFNVQLPKNLEKYFKDNYIQIIKVTSKPVMMVTNSDIIVSINSNWLNNDNRKIYFEYSISLIKKLAQFSNIKKIQHYSNQEYKNKKGFLAIMVKLVYLFESKDKYTRMHLENVANYSVMIGRELNLSEKELEILNIGAILHDIGKLGIPDHILNKESDLTKEEIDIIKRHSTLGAFLLPENEFKEIKQMIRSHHEKIDGTGYPDGLKGDNIPYFARILSVADAFDAMTTQRAYNKRKTLNEALEELYKVSRKKYDLEKGLVQHLDTELVNTFIKAVKKDQKLLEEFHIRDKEIIEERRKENLMRIRKK